MAKVVHWTPTFAKRRARHTSRIFICINGEGYGHSSRALAVARHLDPESIIFGTYGYVKNRIDRAGYRTIEVGPEVKFFGADGSFELSKTILKNASAPLLMSKQFRDELKIMKDFKITCVLSDCRAVSVFAAAKLGIPSLYMTNQTEFEHFFHRKSKTKKGQDVPLAETTKAIQDAILGGAAEPPVDFAVRAMFKEINEIIIADFPPPNTICLPMLSRKPQVMKLQRMVGPVTSWTADEVISHGRPASGPYVVGTLGGHKYRLPLFNALVEAATLMPDVHFDIFSSFVAEKTPPNLRVIEFTENPERYYKAADLVVSQAGHSTAMELLTLGKPSLLVPDFKQIEQESNAQRMVELGVSSQMTYPDLTAQGLADRIRHHLQTASYEVSAYQLARLANEMNGARRVATLVNEYGNRVTAY